MVTTLTLAFFMILVKPPIISKGFVLNDQACVNIQSCTCAKTAVICDFKSLTAVPEFTPLPSSTSEHLYMFSIRLNGNKISTVPNNAFKNFSSVIATSFSLYLDMNAITTIESGAFVGVENTLTELRLQRNHLTCIPAAIGTLSKLKVLQIADNPLQSIDAGAAAALGGSLSDLSIDMFSFPAWPDMLSAFKALKSLSLGKVKPNQIPDRAFQGFGMNLTSLSISSSNLATAPTALCSLHSLKIFQFTDNTDFATKTPFFKTCQNKLENCSLVVFNHNRLSSFPNIFQIFPEVRQIRMNENGLTGVASDLIPNQNNVSSLIMSENMLTSIPSAFAKLSSLTTLSLSHNSITGLQDSDLSGLTRLLNLELDYNPLTFISNGALSNCPNLKLLDLEADNLSAIPAGLPGLAHLTRINMVGNVVACNCSMTYLKDWDLSRRSLSGFCNGDQMDQTLAGFITGQLQKCA